MSFLAGLVRAPRRLSPAPACRSVAVRALCAERPIAHEYATVAGYRRAVARAAFKRCVGRIEREAGHRMIEIDVVEQPLHAMAARAVNCAVHGELTAMGIRVAIRAAAPLGWAQHTAGSADRARRVAGVTGQRSVPARKRIPSPIVLECDQRAETDIAVTALAALPGLDRQRCMGLEATLVGICMARLAPIGRACVTLRHSPEAALGRCPGAGGAVTGGVRTGQRKARPCAVVEPLRRDGREVRRFMAAGAAARLSQ